MSKFTKQKAAITGPPFRLDSMHPGSQSRSICQPRKIRQKAI